MRTGAAYIALTGGSWERSCDVGQWSLEGGLVQGGASASKAAQRTPWGISKASSSSREFRLDARMDFSYFQRLNL